jgi:hypothetical protein
VSKDTGWLREKEAAASLPPIKATPFYMHAETMNRDEVTIDQVEVECKTREYIPVKWCYNKDVTRYLHFVKVLDLLHFVLHIHGHYEEKEKGELHGWMVVDVSIDGVAASNASATKMTVVSLMWPECGRPFVQAIHQVFKGRYVQLKDTFITLILN